MIWKFFAFIAYYVIAIPLVFFYCYVICGFRVKNRKAIRKIRKAGFFLYANHSHFTDAFLAPIVAFPKRAYVIVGPDTVSIKGLRNFVQMVGAIPIPQGLRGMASFLDAIRLRTEENCCISVFPEAHLWNYCTFLRPLKSGSFRYPIHLGVPSVAVAVTYQRRKLRFIKQPKRPSRIKGGSSALSSSRSARCSSPIRSSRTKRFPRRKRSGNCMDFQIGKMFLAFIFRQNLRLPVNQFKDFN